MGVDTSVYIATSLDGYIARPDGGLDWLTGNGVDSTEDYGYEEFFATVDCLVMGRKTYETVLEFGQWPYGDREVYVMTRRPEALRVPEGLAGKVRPTDSEPTELMSLLDRRGKRHAYVDGGQVIQSFLREGMIDAITITRIPVLLGAGLPLFGALPGDVQLEHLQTKSYESGYVQSSYRVRK